MVRWVYSSDVILFEIEMFVKCRATRESGRAGAGPGRVARDVGRTGPFSPLIDGGQVHTRPDITLINQLADPTNRPNRPLHSIQFTSPAPLCRIHWSLRLCALQRKLRNPRTKSRGTMICCSVGIKVILLSDRSVLVTFISLKNLEPVMVMQGFTLVPVNCNFIS